MPVYVIQAGDDGPCKIGHAANVPRRLAGMQTATHVQLRVVAVYEGGEPEERALHEQFKAVRLKGEWFTLPEDALRDIKLKPFKPPDKPDKRPYIIALMDDKGIEPVGSRYVGRDLQHVELVVGIRTTGPDGRPPWQLIRLSNAFVPGVTQSVGVDVVLRAQSRFALTVARCFVRKPMGAAA